MLGWTGGFRYWMMPLNGYLEPLDEIIPLGLNRSRYATYATSVDYD